MDEINQWLDKQTNLLQESAERLARRSRGNPLLVVQFFKRHHQNFEYDDIVTWIESFEIAEEIHQVNQSLSQYVGIDAASTLDRGLCISNNLLTTIELVLHKVHGDITSSLSDDITKEELGPTLMTSINTLSEVARLLPNVMRENRFTALSLQKFRNEESVETGILQGIGKARNMFMSHENVRDKPNEERQLEVWDYIEIRTMEELVMKHGTK